MTKGYDLRVYRKRNSNECFLSVIPLDREMLEKWGLNLVGKYEGLTPFKVATAFNVADNHRGTPRELNSKIEQLASRDSK